MVNKHNGSLWKIHKFCEHASLDELRERERKLAVLVQDGQLRGTNARVALMIMREYIDLKSLFDEDD